MVLDLLWVMNSECFKESEIAAAGLHEMESKFISRAKFEVQAKSLAQRAMASLTVMYSERVSVANASDYNAFARTQNSECPVTVVWP